MPFSKCEVCKEKIAKYKCPGCFIKTCSLPCVKQHKVNKGCNGQRNKGAYIAVKQFKDTDLLNDYRWLEEVGRKTSNAYRDDLKRKRNKPGFLVRLIDEAKKRGIDLKTQPFPMSKRKNNYTTYNFRNKCILWQVELVFVQADATFTARRISENDKLSEILVPYIDPAQSDPVIRHKLKQYCTGGRYHIYMKVEGRPAKSVRYHEVHLDKTLKENLHNKCIIEYPTLYIVMSDYCHNYQLLTDESVKKSKHLDSNEKTVQMDCEQDTSDRRKGVATSKPQQSYS